MTIPVPRTIYTADWVVPGDELGRQLTRLRDELTATISHSEQLRWDAASRAAAAEQERDRLLAAMQQANAKPPHDEMERLWHVAWTRRQA